MKLKFLLLCGIVTFFFACEKDATTVDLDSQQKNLVDEALIANLFIEGDHWDAITYPSSQKKNPVTKKFKIRAAGTMIMTPDSPDCGGFIQVSVRGEGNATHLGLFTIELDYCSDGIAPLGPIYATQTAANGDKLFSVVVGGDPSVNSLDFLYYDGTGRFEGGSGFITLFFEFDYANQTFSNYGEGTITY